MLSIPQHPALDDSDSDTINEIEEVLLLFDASFQLRNYSQNYNLQKDISPEQDEEQQLEHTDLTKDLLRREKELRYY